ncbi:MAG: radical SAM family heme chaperone HemW [Acidimicrobiia bacterium]
MYIHIPFCAHRCDYCDFATWTDRDAVMLEYVDACIRDLQARYATDAVPPADTVFFGGGTPSLLAPDLLARVLDAVPRGTGAEVTVECNPESVDARKLATWRDHGVNRLSLGAQSFVPHVLSSLGRQHEPLAVGSAIALARTHGFERINVDLIFGAAGESVADWERTLETAIALDVDHISAYALTVEPGTPLAAKVREGVITSPDDDDQAHKYEIADARLTDAGYAWYEISNWARVGQECRHNLGYWHGGEWLGIGCAAHGLMNGRRWWNVRTPERYISAIAAGESAEAGSEPLDASRQAEDHIVLGLRTVAGVELPESAQVVAAELAADGFLQLDGAHARLTRSGRLLANEVTTRLVLAANGSPAGSR